MGGVCVSPEDGCGKHPQCKELVGQTIRAATGAAEGGFEPGHGGQGARDADDAQAARQQLLDFGAAAGDAAGAQHWPPASSQPISKKGPASPASPCSTS
ncbi:hypothetical protein DIPPA_24664 [Diplonema papillatum]|nr:hypothetical protein DIPPA_24664 [Diplonema papillatum]